MANVLPADLRRAYNRNLTARFVIAFALMVGVCGVIASLALVPSFISVKVAAAQVQNAAGELSQEAKDDQAKQLRAQAILTALQPITQASSSSPFTVIEGTLEAQPPGLSITSIRYQKGQITLSGVASNRESVSLFRDALEKSALFSNIAVPVAALVGAQEGRFTITLSGAF